MKISAPDPISEHHPIDGFNCGKTSLNEWLKRRALRNQFGGASRTYVTCTGDRVIAYYSLAPGAVAVKEATGKLKRNMPDPVPVVILGRLAVDRSYHGQGLGRALVQDAGRRILHAADEIGIRGVLVHAVDDEAKGFYHRLGFDPSPLDPMTLMITLADIRASLEG